MIKDAKLELAAAQALTASAVSENVIDLGAAGDAENPLFVVVRVHTALASAGHAATLKVGVQTDSVEGFGSAETLIESGLIAEAALIVSSEAFKVKLPRGLKRYVRLNFTVGTESFTSGKVDAFLVQDTDSR